MGRQAVSLLLKVPRHACCSEGQYLQLDAIDLNTMNVSGAVAANKVDRAHLQGKRALCMQNPAA